MLHRMRRNANKFSYRGYRMLAAVCIPYAFSACSKGCAIWLPNLGNSRSAALHTGIPDLRLSINIKLEALCKMLPLGAGGVQS